MLCRMGRCSSAWVTSLAIMGDRNRSRFRRLHKRRYRCTRDAVLAAFGRRAILDQAAGREQEIAVGVFRIDARFHRRSAQLDVALLDGERLAGGDADYLLDEIDAGDEAVTGFSTCSRVFISRK